LIEIAAEAIAADAPASDVTRRAAVRIRDLKYHFRRARPRFSVQAVSSADARTVSVVMPVFNGATDTPKAIESLFQQTFQDFEIIAVNDGSSDDTASVLNSIADPRLRVVHQDNVGLARTLNRGVSLARGKYIARLDHDDIAKPTRLEMQVAFLNSHQQCGLVGTRSEIWVEDQATGRVHDHPIDNNSLQFELLFDNFFVHSSVMSRKSLFVSLGGYATDPERPIPEDYELWSRFARCAEVANLPDRLTIYREFPRSLSRRDAACILQGVARISAENLAAIVEAPQVCEVHRDAAFLAHGMHERLSRSPDIEAVCRLVRQAATKINGGNWTPDMSARVEARIKPLRHSHAHAVATRRRESRKRRFGSAL